MILSEEQVYSGTKKFLKKNNFLLLGGQPPRGVDHIPVIEIKDFNYTGKGSMYSYKPDLVAFKKNKFFIIECKSKYNIDDYYKLKEILNSNNRLNSLYNILEQRNLLKKNNINISLDYFKENIFGVLSYSTEINLNDLYYIKVNNFQGDVKTNLII